MRIENKISMSIITLVIRMWWTSRAECVAENNDMVANQRKKFERKILSENKLAKKKQRKNFERRNYLAKSFQRRDYLAKSFSAKKFFVRIAKCKTKITKSLV
jgi:hypothetical protein